MIVEIDLAGNSNFFNIRRACMIVLLACTVVFHHEFRKKRGDKKLSLLYADQGASKIELLHTQVLRDYSKTSKMTNLGTVIFKKSSFSNYYLNRHLRGFWAIWAFLQGVILKKKSSFREVRHFWGRHLRGLTVFPSAALSTANLV